MQDYITEDSLNKLGISTEGQDTVSLLEHLNETLEERVGAEITDSLDDSQLKALLDLQETGTEQEVGDWMKNNVPEFEQIIQDEVDIILGELADSSEGINKTV
jgi:uncharacterized protein DUF5663